MQNAFELPNLSKKLSFKGPETSYIQKYLLTDSHSKNVWDWIYFSCEIAHYEKSFASVFQEWLTSIKKNLIVAGGLGTGLSLYGIETLSWYFQTS